MHGRPRGRRQTPFQNESIIKFFFVLTVKNPPQSVILSMPVIVYLRDVAAIFFHPGSDCLSFEGGGVEMSAASPLLPFSQHVGLCVCEDSSCILRSRSRGKHLPLSPRSPSSELLLPSSNINGCWFFNEEVGVPVQRVRRGLASGRGIEEKGEREEMYWCKTHPPAEKLKRQPSRVGLSEREKKQRKNKGGGSTHSKYCHALRQPSKRKTSQLQHSCYTLNRQCAL